MVLEMRVLGGWWSKEKLIFWYVFPFFAKNFQWIFESLLRDSYRFPWILAKQIKVFSVLFSPVGEKQNMKQHNSKIPAEEVVNSFALPLPKSSKNIIDYR